MQWDLSRKFGTEWHEFEELVSHCKAKNIDVKGNFNMIAV